MTTASWHRPELKMARSCATRISAGCSTSGGMWAKDAQRRSPLCRLFHLCPRHTHLSLCVVNLYAEPCQFLTPLIVAGFAYLPQEVFVGQTLRPSRDLGSTTVCSTLTTAGLNLADSGRSGREVRTSAGLYRGGRKDSMGRRSMLSSLASSLASLQAAFSSGSSCCSCCSCDIEFGSTKGTWLLLSPPPPAPSTPAPTPPHLISDIHISFLTCPSHFS